MHSESQKSENVSSFANQSLFSPCCSTAMQNKERARRATTHPNRSSRGNACGEPQAPALLRAELLRWLSGGSPENLKCREKHGVLPDLFMQVLMQGSQLSFCNPCPLVKNLDGHTQKTQALDRKENSADSRKTCNVTKSQ